MEYNHSPTVVETDSLDNEELVPQEVFTPAVQELYGWINVQRSISGMILSHTKLAIWVTLEQWVHTEILKSCFSFAKLNICVAGLLIVYSNFQSIISNQSEW